MRKKIKIYFTDFWGDFDINNNFFTELLKNDFDIEINSHNPDLIFYSVFGVEFKSFNCKRIFFTGENIRPNYHECDFSFSFDHGSDPRNYRLPLYALYGDVNELTLTKPNPDELMKSKTKFCNFIYSNPNCKVRNSFFKELSKYKKVDSAGRLFNNTKFLAPNKLDFIKDYKFTIAFENVSYPGYTTEKIFEPMLIHSMPIYWGNNLVNLDFNPKSFVNCHDFPSMEAVIDEVIALDNDDSKYLEYYKNPYFHDNTVNTYVNRKNIISRLKFVIKNSNAPIAQQKPSFYYNPTLMKYRMNTERAKYRMLKMIDKMEKLSLYKLKTKINELIR